MRGWLLDTNVVSELRRPRPSAKLLGWMREAGTENLFISVITIAEIRIGIEMQEDPNLRVLLDNWLETKVRPMFAGRTFTVGEGELTDWRLLAVKLAKSRKSVPEPDLLISAVARHNRVGIATRNVRDFKASGVELLNPFTGERFNGP